MTSNATKKPTVAVIGTGFTGICAAIKVKQELGIDAELFEIAKDVGGTWEANTYPGLECDIPSHVYSFSFEPNPNWTRHFSPQAEIHTYLRNIAKKYDLYKNTRFETEMIRAEWNEKENNWLLEWRNVSNHQEIGSGSFDFVFAGLGPFRVPKYPQGVPIDNFDGPVVHTARWDHSIDFTNKKVAVIGSGATAVQLIPALRKLTHHLYSYQRTPAWVIKRNQFNYSRITKFLFRWVPLYMWVYRLYLFFRVDLSYIKIGYYNTWIGRFLRNLTAKSMASRLQRVGRSDLIPKLIPDFPLGCKRITKSEVYLEALAEKNVTLIRSGIKSIQGRTLVDNDGNEAEVDVLVLATGYDVQQFTGNFDVYGRNNTRLVEQWMKYAPRTYKTVAMHGFPNLFLAMGPSAGLTHHSAVVMIEIQIDYAIKCMKHLGRNGLAAIEPKAAAQEAFITKLQKSFDGTAFKGGCSSIFLDQNNEIFGIWSGTVCSFWRELRKPNYNDFLLYKKN
ncbi:monooxygenase [Phascolomyces articulosus]|uniref:Monooxygenase n=1 Tax=Phascolomyces articulosus TaxID=60185 RepID=A0AAD5K6G1_9FUNG|nr:monooxygenase [Phascolomyces articulosus]